MAGYRGQGYKGIECEGAKLQEPIVQDFQNLWYVRGNITNILDEPNTIGELFAHRETLEREIKRIRDNLKGE